MARKTRIEFEGAFYHVITRGNQRQKIFKHPDDFTKYIETIAKYKEKYGFALYAYALMTNHVHLLIETGKVPLSKIIQGVNQTYTIYYNKQYRTVGHLFQGRYKAILCNRDEYLLTLLKYIHLNPVRAKIAETAAGYKWSSHGNYAGKSAKGSIIDTDMVLRMFSEDKTTASKLYRAYIGDPTAVIRKEDIYATVDQRVLGDEEFVEKAKEKSGTRISGQKRAKEHSLTEIATAVENIYGISLKDIRGRGKARELTTAKKMISLVAREYAYKNNEVAEFIRKDPVIVTRHTRDADRFQKEVEHVVAYLKGRSKRIKCL